MRKNIALFLSVLFVLLYTSAFAENVTEIPPVIKSDCQNQAAETAPNYGDELESISVYSANISEWFDNNDGAVYYYETEEKFNTVKFNENTGEFTYRPWTRDVGKTQIIYFYAENEHGKSDKIKLSIYINKALNAPDSEFALKSDTYQKNMNAVSTTEIGYDGLAIAGDLRLNGNKILQVLVDEKETGYILLGNKNTGKPSEIMISPTTQFQTDTQVWGLKKSICDSLEEGEHQAKIIFNGGNDIEFTFYIEDMTEYQVTYSYSQPEGETINTEIIIVDQILCKKGNTVTLPALQDTPEYTFAGWWSVCENPEDSKQYTSDTPIESNVSLKSKWEERFYTVTYIVDDKEYSNSEVKYNTTATLPKPPSRSGYSFDGWNVKENGQGEPFTEGTAVVSDITVYAEFTKNETSNGYIKNSGGKTTILIHQNTDSEKTAIKRISRKKFITGYPDGTFQPEKNITRSEAAIILARISDDYSEGHKNEFTDVPSNEWYTNAALYLNSKADLNTYEFKPNENITRIDFCIWLCKILNINIKPQSSGNYFKDIEDISGAGYVNTLFELGVIEGYENNLFKPYNGITRAEVTAIISRKCMEEDFSEDYENSYSDVTKNHWAYKDIIKAGNFQK